ncbi:MAG: L-histidine N(alpha)-methyltransferase [bacterium]
MAKANLVRHDHDDRLILHQLDRQDHRLDFQEAVATGLAHSPKSIPPKFFYDARGSELFEEITRLPEYYPTRTETALLERHRDEILAFGGERIGLVELGSGSSTKTRLLLDRLTQRQAEVEYSPIDISPSIVAENGKLLLDDYPGLRVSGLICDYHDAMEALGKDHPHPRLFLFFGSSLGNFDPEEAVVLLEQVRAAMDDGDRFLLGVDLAKDPEILEAAYNDAKGVTAAFNLNLLTHINTALGGHFDPDRFRHHAFFNEAESRIEMHLVSQESQIVPIEAIGRSFSFLQGETIHTENSYKFSLSGLDASCREAGLHREAQWLDDRRWFVLALLAKG